MKQKRAWSGIASSCLLLLFLVTGIARAVDCGNGIATCGCGDTVVSDYTLATDLICPPSFNGNALTLGADGITIDGQGLYKVEAAAAVAVIQNRLHSDWTLRDIAIKGGLFGIQSDARPLPNGAQGISILNVDASSPQDFGQRIRFLDTHASRVENSQADGGKTGIYNLNGDGNQYLNTSVSWLPRYGPLPAGQTICVDLIGVRDNLVEGITANSRKIGVVISANTNNPSWGSRTADRNIVRDSDLSGNQLGISFAFEGHGNQFLNNDLSNTGNVALAVNGDAGVILSGNDYSDVFIGISLSNFDAEGRTVLADTDLTTVSGTYGLRVHNVSNAGFERIAIGSGARQSLWWSGGSTGNSFHQIAANGHTFGLLSQDAHNNLVTDSDFSWTGGERQATGIDLRLGSTENIFDNVTVHARVFGAQISGTGGGTTILNSDLSDNHNCLFAQATDPAAGQKFHHLQLKGCTGNALTVAFDHLLDLHDLDFAGSSGGLLLRAMDGISLDGEARNLKLGEVLHRGLVLTDVNDSSFTRFIVGGSQWGVSLATSHRNLFSEIDASWPGPVEDGNGFFLDRSVENTIQSSWVANRDLGLQILSGSNNNQLHCNSLIDNRQGALNNFGATGNHLNLNVITGNSVHGVRNTDPLPLDARENYWGAVDGPSPIGGGDAISGPVDVTPFLSAPGGLDALCGRIDTPRALKTQAIELLEAVLPTGDRHADRRIQQAIDWIHDSLKDPLWADDEHLVKGDGKSVFDAERRAARKLLKALDRGLPPAIEDAMIQTLTNLLLADRLLAEVAIAEATVAIEMSSCEPAEDEGDSDSDSDSGSSEPACDCNLAWAKLTKAHEKMTQAQDEIDSGNFDRAIKRYKKAWERALDADCAVAGCDQ